ncbi:phosphonatase-like hydrolase [Pseudonocardia sp. KRD291]|uniref:phosphonatase-like hydrolase n=1 Tax=Pseudonocardia sp. KRD291 TaxID=2792007 RepID=UPI001C4A51D5|nr:phosphonatase-like hydrolase [Pseudonocardia sp. KRD291]MBW0104221.1 phosphonatase-like hydrolase [Pseudonocardia sp. KRD291]
MTISLAAFDIAGTTVDEGGAVYRVLADVVADHGTAAPDADIRRWMGADKREALAALTGDAGAVDELHAAFVKRLHAAYAEVPPAPLPGVPEALAALRGSGVRVVLTTGFDRQVTDPLLAALGWTVGETLDGVVCAEEVAAGRPKPFMIQEAMRVTGVGDPAEVLVAGDTVLDVRAGRAAGAGLVVGVLTGAQTREELAAEHPTHVLDGVADVPGLLSSLR